MTMRQWIAKWILSVALLCNGLIVAAGTVGLTDHARVITVTMGGELHMVDIDHNLGFGLGVTPIEPPVWSPDGQTLMVATRDTHPRWQIYTLPDARAQVFEPLSSSARDLSFSPDGTQLAYAATGHVFILHLESGMIRQISDQQAYYGSLRWSPDGERLAFIHLQGDFDLVSILGYNVQQATPPYALFSHATRNLDYTNWRWSPDGESILYATNRQLQQYDILTGEHHELTRANNPDWSPDGARLASVREGNLLLIDPVTGSERVMAFEEAIDRPTWSPDGRSLVVTTTELGQGLVPSLTLAVIDDVDAADAQPRTLVQFSGVAVWRP